MIRTAQSIWSVAAGWDPAPHPLDGGAAAVLLFGCLDSETLAARMDDLGRIYPGTPIVGCTTAGQIVAEGLLDRAVAATAIAFDHSRVEFARIAVNCGQDAAGAGRRLIESLPQEGLRHVLVFYADPSIGGGLVADLQAALPEGVGLTGGAAGDMTLSDEPDTSVWLNQDGSHQDLVAIGLYGERLRIGTGAAVGWRPFGPERLITRARQNVVLELDGRPALDIYQRYLEGDGPDEPIHSLNFPLGFRDENGEYSLPLAVLGLDAQTRGLKLSAPVAEGDYTRLMRASLDEMVQGASQAAADTVQQLGGVAPQLSLLVSCDARRRVLHQRTEEELEAVRESIGLAAAISGFFSYGEIAWLRGRPQFLNQSISITSMAEV
jgi:hypothetical protein